MNTVLLALLVATQSRIAAWDTVAASERPWGSDRAGWKTLSRGATARGDAAVTNGRLLVVARRNAGSVEIHPAATRGNPVRMRLALLGADDAPAATLASATLAERGRTTAGLEVSYRTPAGKVLSARLRLRRGDAAVEIEPGGDTRAVRIEVDSRFAVLPDFFSNDIVIDATTVPSDRAEIPSENFVLHPVGGGSALAMVVFEHRDQDVRLRLSGTDGDRRIRASEVEFGKGKKVWAALIEAPGAWHHASVTAKDAGREVPLEWTMPFPAQWRVDFTRTDELIHSWEMLLRDPDGDGYLKPTFTSARLEKFPANRKWWMGSYLYTVEYPCWSDASGRGHLQPLKKGWLKYDGPVLVYPANRVPSTPVDAFTVVDVIRNTLGQGPCEYILSLESQGAHLKGRATCSVRDELKMMYEKGQQVARRADAERFLDQGLEFVKHIRGRIDGYLKLISELRALLEKHAASSPDLRSEIAVLKRILAEADGHIEAREKHLKPVSHVVRLTEDFRRTMLGYQGDDALTRLKKYTDELTEIGDAQDGLVARLRWVVKTVRERAAVQVTRNPRMAPLSREIRKRSREALKNPAVHEERR